MSEEKEVYENDFLQFHKDVAKIVDKYIVEVEIPAIRARRMIPFCYFGIAVGSFLMFLACV